MLIKSARLIDPRSGTDKICDIALEGGRVLAIGELSGEAYGETLDASGLVAAPGFVDVHVHFRDPGLTYKEDILSGAAAAARGGFTTVVCMANTKPVVDNPDTLSEVLEKAKAAPINVRTIAAVSRGFAGEELTDMAVLSKMGAVGFSDDGIPLMDADFLRNAMHMTKALDAVISLHEEDYELVGIPGINAGVVAEEMGIKGATAASESTMLERDCKLALETGARLHLQHISCAESVEIIRRAKKQGGSITAEVTPQHLALTEDAIRKHGTHAKLNPPLRTEADRQALIAGLCDGTIDFIATDHAPHSEEEKAKSFTEAPSGLTGLETALSVCITTLVESGAMTLPQLVEKMSTLPSALYGFDAGYIAEGAPADIVLFDPHAKWIVGDFASKASNSPFTGSELCGVVKHTICGGEVVYSANF